MLLTNTINSQPDQLPCLSKKETEFLQNFRATSLWLQTVHKFQTNLVTHAMYSFSTHLAYMFYHQYFY